MSITSTFKSMNRLKQIVNLLFKEELGFLISKLKLKPHLEVKHQLKKSEFKKPITSLPQRFRRVMEKAGGGMIKLGQLLSLRSDLLPKEYCDEFSKLQDQIPPFSYIQVKKIIEAELKKPINQVFTEFQRTPIAAASVGQVHKAKLKTGEVVAVKVRRPGIEKIFKIDTQLLNTLAKLADKHIKEVKPLNLPRVAKVFEEYTKKELDYTKEAKNIELIYQRNKGNKQVQIPKVYWEETTSKVLTMQFMDGKKISELKLTKDQRKKVATIVSEHITKQVFDYHIFHADPHPGNVLISKGKVQFIDFGIVGRLSPDVIEYLEDLFIGLIKGDLNLITNGFLELGIVDTEINKNQFREDLFQRLSPYHNVSLKTMRMGDFVHDVFDIARKYSMQFPTNFVLLLKSMATAEGFQRKIYPEANFVALCRPKVDEIIKKRKNLKNIAKGIKKNAWNFSRSIKKIPQDLRSLLYTFKKGTNVRVDIDNRDVRELTHEIGSSSNKVTFGFIIGALIVGFALIVLAGVQPQIYGIPYLALLLLIIIIILSLFLGIAMLWEKRGGEL